MGGNFILANWDHVITTLKRCDKHVALSLTSMYYTWKNKHNSYKNNKSKISNSTWNYKFDLPDGLYSVSDIQDYFE